MRRYPVIVGYIITGFTDVHWAANEPGAMLENAGVIRFTPERGGTRVDLRCCYQAPNGRRGSRGH